LHFGGTIFFAVLMVTRDPRKGIEVMRLVKPKTAIPNHYDDYSVGRRATHVSLLPASGWPLPRSLANQLPDPPRPLDWREERR
jgi:hypothetical protein